MVAFAKEYLSAPDPARTQNRAEFFFEREAGRVTIGALQSRMVDGEYSRFTYDACQSSSLAQGEKVFAPDTPSAVNGPSASSGVDLALTADGAAMDDADTFTIKGHGTVGIVRVDATGARLDGAGLAKLIMNHPNYRDSVDCVMFICKAGAGSNSLAQQVADITGLTVIAADGYVGQYNHVVYANSVNGRGANPWQGVGWRTFTSTNPNTFIGHWNNVMTRQSTQQSLSLLQKSMALGGP